MFSSENHEGKLVELRVTTPISAQEIVDLQKTHLEVTGRVEGDSSSPSTCAAPRCFRPRSPSASSG